MSNKTLVVNLFGGPGVSKSTSAAGVFSHLKQKGVSCELITEYAKDRTWLNDSETLACQPYVSAKQLWRMVRVDGKVDVMITDSPLLLGLIYAGPWESGNFTNIIFEWFKKFDNLNVLLSRDLQKHPYKQIGRTQSVDEAINIDNCIASLLKKHGLEHTLVPGGPGAIEVIEQLVLTTLEERAK